MISVYREVISGMPAGWYLRTDTVWAFVIEFGGEFEGVEIMKKYLLANFDFFPKLRTAVYPSNKARIGAKLWENAFRTICNFSFFDVPKKKMIKFLQTLLSKCLFVGVEK